MENFDWTLEAKQQIDNHGLPQLDFSHFAFQTVNGALNAFVKAAMTEGSHPDGRMTTDEVQSLLIWILARHKANVIQPLLVINNAMREEHSQSNQERLNNFSKLSKEVINLRNDAVGCSQLLNEMFKWAKVKDGKATFTTSEETWNTYKQFVKGLSVNEQIQPTEV
jgi:hypothetical protein